MHIGSATLDFDTDQWTDIIDRVGLIHVSDLVFRLFLEIEEEVRSTSISAAQMKRMGFVFQL